MKGLQLLVVVPPCLVRMLRCVWGWGDDSWWWLGTTHTHTNGSASIITSRGWWWSMFPIGSIPYKLNILQEMNSLGCQTPTVSFFVQLSLIGNPSIQGSIRMRCGNIRMSKCVIKVHQFSIAYIPCHVKFMFGWEMMGVEGEQWWCWDIVVVMIVATGGDCEVPWRWERWVIQFEAIGMIWVWYYCPMSSLCGML